MKHRLQTLLLLVLPGFLCAQAISINTDASAPDPSAILDVKSIDKGMLVPRMSTAQRTAIAAPATGLLVFDTTTGSFWFYDGIVWTNLSSNIGGGDNWGTQAAVTNPVLAGDGTAGNPLAIAQQGATNGQVLKWNGFLWSPANDNSSDPDNWGSQVALTNPSLAGDGTAGNPLRLAPQGASNGQILRWNGTTWGPADYNDSNGDNWGSQVALTNPTLAGDGTGGDPLRLAQQGATISQVLQWNGTVWAPASNVTALLRDTDGNTKVQVEKSPNEDILRVDLGGSEKLALLKNADGAPRLELKDANFNTFIGDNAGTFNTTGVDNTATGVKALYSNINGFGNTANGGYALQYNTAGNNNTATGKLALFSNINGSHNTANGWSALYNNTTGNNNTAIGEGALASNTTGDYNTAIGDQALNFNTAGNYNTAIGEHAYFSNNSLNNTICIGYFSGGTSNVSNRVEIGNNEHTWIGGQVGWSTYSDARIKNKVQENVPGLTFITRLRPVTYHLDIHKQNEMCFRDKKKIADWPEKYDIEKKQMTGFIAQEVEQAARAVGYDFSGVEKASDEVGLYSVRYSDFIMPLVKAVQEQQALIETQAAENAALKAQLEAQAAQLQRIAAALQQAGITVEQR